MGFNRFTKPVQKVWNGYKGLSPNAQMGIQLGIMGADMAAGYAIAPQGHKGWASFGTLGGMHARKKYGADGRKRR